MKGYKCGARRFLQVACVLSEMAKARADFPPVMIIAEWYGELHPCGK